MIDTLKEYIEKRINLVKIETTEKGALLSGLIYFLMVALIFLLFFISFLVIGLGIWIGELLGNYAYGFFIMSGICLFIFLFVLLLRKPIQNFAANALIKFLNS